jgi:hypothetical protein
MAKTDDKKTASAISTAPAADPWAEMLKGFLPAGFDLADFQTIGGLRPIVSADLMYEHKFPIVGRVVAILDMPQRKSLNKADEKEDWSTILVELLAPCRAKSGNDIITVEAGKEIMIPRGGNLKNNRDLELAARDPNFVHTALFICTGEVDLGVNGRNPMWGFEVRISPKLAIRREPGSKYSFAGAPVVRHLSTGEGVTQDGEIVDGPTNGRDGRRAQAVA